MKNKLRQRWCAVTWVRNEIDINVDGSGNTPEQAAEFVLDLLREGEYREELSDRQVASAIRVVEAAFAKLKGCES